jgi:hypothetical protein
MRTPEESIKHRDKSCRRRVGTRRLIVLPDDSAEPILSAIAGAWRTLQIKMFVFSPI